MSNRIPNKQVQDVIVMISYYCPDCNEKVRLKDIPEIDGCFEDRAYRHILHKYQQHIAERGCPNVITEYNARANTICETEFDTCPYRGVAAQGQTLTFYQLQSPNNYAPTCEHCGTRFVFDPEDGYFYHP